MAHVHPHAEDQTSYYLDQLFMIAICGALAGVTITLWYSGLLGKILADKFHTFVLLGGLSLLALVVLRAAAVWRSVDETIPHPHDHPHDHDHACCDHEHAHAEGSTAVATAPAAHVHSHSHGHGHGHAHTHSHGHSHGWAPWRYVVLLLPVVLYFLILSNPAFDREPVYTPVTGMDMVINFIIRFRSIVWEALPFIVLGAVIAGLLEELLPQQAITRFLPRNPFLAVGLGGLLGLVFPMCECGIVPIMRRLLRKGLPLSCCIAYVLAGPIINVVVLTSTFVAFSGMENTYEGGNPSYQMGGWWMMGLRAGLGYLVAVTTALVVEWQYRKHGDALLTPLTRRGALPAAEENGLRKKTLWERVNNVSETALHDFVDITVFLILGALLSAGTVLLVSQEQIAELSRQHAPLAILAMMGLAILLCLCSEADAFVAASFVTMRPAAKLAFLVLGPMIDFKLYFMYTRVFRPRLIWTIYLAVVTQVFVLSYATHLIWERVAPSLIQPVPPPGQGPPPALKSAARAFGLGASPAGEGPLAAALSLVAEKKSEKAAEVTFSQLERASASPEARSYYEGRRVKLRGRYREISDRSFTLIRYTIRCCAADAIPLKAVIRLDPAAPGAFPVAKLRDKWVLVTGEVRFLQQPGTGAYYTALLVHPTAGEPLNELVEEVPPDNNPFSS